MDTPAAKQGRPRRYDLQPPRDFANREIAFAVAALDELRARASDQILDLPAEALTFVPQGSTLSIAALVIHMAWAEVGWVARITGFSVPMELRARLDPVGQAVPKGAAPQALEEASLTAEELVALCRRVRDEVTYPALREVADATQVMGQAQRPLTPRGVLMHLIWHWTYHSGQIGLLRELAGFGYNWTFGSLESSQ